MCDSEASTASESGVPFEEVNCSGVKVETGVDVESGNNYDQTRDLDLRNEHFLPGNECAIERLLQRPFSTLSYQEKIRYVENDRPMESLNGLFKPSKGRRSFTRHFNTKSYETVPWLSGCNRLGKLFCWPCLLFCPVKNVWNFFGYEDLNHFHAAVKRHRMSSHHITSFKELKQFVKMKREFCIGTQFQSNVPSPNSEVRKNRKVLGHVIKAVCFLAKEGLLSSQQGKKINGGTCVELLNEISDYDHDLKTFLTNSPHFPIFFTDNNNTLEVLIASICEVMMVKVKEKISESPCVALILDEIGDGNKSLISTCVRYMDRDGHVRETFLGFKHMGKELRVKMVALHLFECVGKFNCDKKLVAYSLDGGVLCPSEYGELETQLRDAIPTARFENYHGHALDALVSQSLCYLKNCKIFFSNLLRFESFFTKSNRGGLTENDENTPIRSASWEYSSRLVTTLHAHQDEILTHLTSVVDSPGKWDWETVSSAQGLRTVLEDFEFNFLLEIFSRLFPEIDKLFRVLERVVTDASVFEKKMEVFKRSMTRLGNDFESIWTRCRRVKSEPEEGVPTKRIRVDTIPGEDAIPSYRELLTEIVRVVVTNVEYRLERLPGLRFANLLDGKRFEKYKTKFPATQLKSLKASYGTHFDFEALKGELSVLCLDKEMEKESVAHLMAYMVSADLVEIFPEVVKLGALILTLPTYVPPEEGSASRRVAAHVGNVARGERSQGLTMLRVEKELLSELRTSSTFTDDVIDVFAKKNPNMSLVYRN